MASNAHKRAPSRGLTWSLVILFFGLLSLPILQMTLRPFPVPTLQGIALPGEFPRLTRSGVMSGIFQRKAEAWLSRKNGLWPLLVQMSNQLYYSLFGQVSGDAHASVLVAREGYFFQPMYLRSFNRSRRLKAKEIKKAPKRVKRLQDALAERGIALVTLVSPNLIALYPELVPDAFVDPTRLSRRNSYDIARPVFDEVGVNIVDAFDSFLKTKGSSPFRFIQPTASHWNDVASCQATALVFEKAAAILKRQLAIPRCTDWHMEMPPPEADRDLVDIANLLLPERTYQPSPVIRSVLSSGGGGTHPRVLLIGTSFLFAIQHQIERFHLAKESPLYFYYRQVRESSDAKLHGLNKRAIDWEKLLQSYDLIVLEVNQSSISAVGYGFVQDALRVLEKAKKNADRASATS